MNAKLGGLIDNKKPALGGLEKAQALRSFLMPTRKLFAEVIVQFIFVHS